MPHVERNYALLFLLGLCVVAGLSEWLPTGRDDAVSVALPGYATIYHVMLLVGGVVGSAGVWTSRLRVGAPLESGGLTLLAATMGGYAIMLVALVRPVPVVTTVVLLTFGLVCVARVRQLNVMVRSYERDGEYRE